LKIVIVKDTKEQAEVLNEYCTKFSREEKVLTQVNIYNNGVSFLNNFKEKYDLVYIN